MLHIILIVLKIIGIIIASLLGVALLLGGLILFVPIRYRAKAKKTEELSVHFVGSWLLHFFHLSVHYDGKVPVMKLRISGIPIFDSTKEKKEKKEKRQKIKRKKEKKEQKPAQEEIIQVMELKPEKQDDLVKEKVNDETPQNSFQGIEEDKIEKTIKQEMPDREQEVSLWQKIKQIVLIIKRYILKFFELFRQMKKTIKNFRETCWKIWQKWICIKEFIQQEENKKGFSSVFESLIQILKKIGPVVVKGKVHFGTGDPCSTGQALGVLGVCYGWFGRQVEIEPDFEHEILEGELFIKGRFQVISLLIIGIKLLKDEGFKNLRMNFGKLKEAL